MTGVSDKKSDTACLSTFWNPAILTIRAIDDKFDHKSLPGDDIALYSLRSQPTGRWQSDPLVEQFE